ncbi:hypothetical protein [Cellulomonas oligotrophica]|uniref:Uncharacterized protein n=1 Tax=Cellulomonas oligotrophica TaxID=931536 RepID=A0A7Y9FH35_9CELL|nr:hypothetical protein [Cellulomonas oligotrophica]NYD87221.1 hypothetical protein [Cellulomonas oligotrophica]GIG34003.1 hypothetical protein Col01nite_31620 [Cellulomonas oligotrophica]
MVYTLSSPTALAVDAACHPHARELLPLLRTAFALDDAARVALTAAAAEQPVEERAVAWGVVELLGAGQGTTFDVLRAAGEGAPLPAPPVLARTRLGAARDVARLLLLETGPWPTGVTAAVPGLGRHPAGAVALAAAAVGRWAGPDLPDEHATTLAAPWQAVTRPGAAPAGASDDGTPGDAAPVDGAAGEETAGPVRVDRVLGERAPAVHDALDALRGARVTDLARIGWPANAWVRAMHEAAWTAFARGRLHAQVVAVLDATTVVVDRAAADAGHGPDGTADPVTVRSALRTAHALVVGALMADALDPDARDCLRLADAGL